MGVKKFVGKSDFSAENILRHRTA